MLMGNEKNCVVNMEKWIIIFLMLTEDYFLWHNGNKRIL